MNKNIIYKELSSGPVEICRELCNQLMAYQAEKAVLWKDILSSMNFDNRLKPVFETSEEKFLLAAFDGETPVGYVFAADEVVTEESRTSRPLWARPLPEEVEWLFPDWLPVPIKIGELNNLYVLPEYHGLGIGNELTGRAMDWLRKRADAKYLFVYVSNGNNAGPFYEHYGFRHSHTVSGGIIEAYSQKNSPPFRLKTDL